MDREARESTERVERDAVSPGGLNCCDTPLLPNSIVHRSQLAPCVKGQRGMVMDTFMRRGRTSNLGVVDERGVVLGVPSADGTSFRSV